MCCGPRRGTNTSRARNGIGRRTATDHTRCGRRSTTRAAKTCSRPKWTVRASLGLSVGKAGASTVAHKRASGVRGDRRERGRSVGLSGLCQVFFVAGVELVMRALRCHPTEPGETRSPAPAVRLAAAPSPRSSCGDGGQHRGEQVTADDTDEDALRIRHASSLAPLSSNTRLVYASGRGSPLDPSPRKGWREGIRPTGPMARTALALRRTGVDPLSSHARIPRTPERSTR
jgi:hypothetical protein